MKSAFPGDFREAVKKALTQTYTDKSGRQRLYSDQLFLRNDYQTCQCFLSVDGRAGVAVTDQGELVSLFSYSWIQNGAGAVDIAVDSGADHLNCYDEDDFLPNLYRKFGFSETAREKWNPEYAPEGWSGDTPDVVWMSR